MWVCGIVVEHSFLVKLLSFHAVPHPTLNITGPPQLIVYEGTNGALTCHILVTITIDTEVNVSAQWIKDGEEVASSNRISIKSAEMSLAITSISFL